MRYQEALDYLYDKLPMFQRVGPPAFKKDLTNTLKLCKALGNPHHQFKSIHIGGTNGKGSSSHMIASILQESGYKTGLYTSPHLKSFTERIKINGLPVPEKYVVGFVNNYKSLIEEVKPSFFEVTVVMAFDYFSRERVDLAVFEVGLGGRLDSTNVLIPVVSLITNISYDHQEMLGKTLKKIASEKAGIIKPGVPVVIGSEQREIIDVFEKKARDNRSLIDLATDYYKIEQLDMTNRRLYCNVLSDIGGTEFFLEIEGNGMYQLKNLPGVLRVMDILIEKGYNISLKQIRAGLAYFQKNTGLKGRWQILREKPLVIADIAHNEAGIKEVLSQLKRIQADKYCFVLGFVQEKDMKKILPLFPKDAVYYFCQADVPRAMDAMVLAESAAAVGLRGRVIRNINMAYRTAVKENGPNNVIYVGGSSFVVSELDCI